MAAQSLRFDGISSPVSLDGCEDLVPVMGEIIPGWPFQALPPGGPAAITLEQTKKRLQADIALAVPA